ncbi:MAG: hydroxyisourate hydrolase [Candidatus Kariarchaeaceae archaeon]|jgi:5-hydroxyisourate hydrolase
MSQITTHVLDTGLGQPGQGISITLYESTEDGWKELGSGMTNTDGRISDLLADDVTLQTGVYRMHFEIGSYFRDQNRPSFYPHADIIFQIENVDEHYHIPLLLSPFGYTTYRGS